MKILSVDDKAENRYLLESLLRGYGHQVESACDGVEALEKLEQQPFDMIISDVLMPRKDGFQLCREVKARESLRRIPFLFYTATYTDKKDEDLGLSLGATRFIIKPQEPERFVAIIEQVIHEEAAQTAPASPGDPLEEEVFLTTYNERLIHKLEHKIEQLEVSTRAREAAIAAKEHEINERKRMEEEYRQAQKMETFGALAGGVAHDFNNMLSVIGMNAEFLSLQSDLSAETVDAVQQITEATRRAANLTRQLLTFSRKQPMHRRCLDINQIPGNLSKLLQRLIREDIIFECRCRPEPLWVNADEGMIEQMLMNLAVNAQDAMPRGGRLIIETQPVHRDGDDVKRSHGARAGDFVCITAQDTGCGIPPELLPRIFEPFFTTKEPGKGTGLGLAIVYGIVQQHEGWIEVVSSEGVGTTFTIYLPIATRDSEPSADAAQSIPSPGGTEGILVVEDESSLRSLIGQCLRRYGYHVIEANNGLEALTLWAQHREVIQLLITDMVMPAGLGGRELAKRLRSEKRTLKTIFISGYNAELSGQEILPNSLNYLPKPFTPSVLAKRVRDCLDAP